MTLPLLCVPVGGNGACEGWRFHTPPANQWKQVLLILLSPLKENGAFLQTKVMFVSALAPWLSGESVSVLVSGPQAQVPLLEGDAVDHHQIVQAVLGRGGSSREPPRLQE